MIPIIRPWLGPEEARAAHDAILSGWIAQGPKVREFEAAFCTATGCAHAVAVSSATTGLHLALHGLGVGPGDEVICPSLSFIATANSIRYCGATPIFADVDPVTQNLSGASIAAVLTKRTKAVLVVHQAGMPCDLADIAAALPGGVAVVEDAACAIGSTYRGAPIGSHSPLVVFSFHPRKLVTCGEGGMVAVRDGALAERLRRLRQHAMTVNDVQRHQSATFLLEQYDELGWNYRMTDIQAAVGLVQLAKLPAMTERRRALAERYTAALAGVGLVLPTDPPWGTTNYQSYCVRIPHATAASRNDILQAMLDKGVMGKRGIMAAHLEPAFAGHPHVPLPHSEAWAADSLVLPLYHEMTASDQDQVVAALQSATRGRI
ncbi:MAG: DegT/DnrJ/EryC1/StrS family aminotransferase [Deltaproteobacteria bacterium]|nr:DegT/DnrJ/EryC1/StrS family aminotransferase [Deltaproteobacteria bacterium]